MGRYFDDNHAGKESQLAGMPLITPDSREVSRLRGAKPESYEELLAFGQALCRQLRYREAIAVYSRAIELNPEDIRAYRQRAGRYLSTAQPGPALQDFYRCRKLGGGEEDIAYRLGLCYFMLGRQEEAMEELAFAYTFSSDEMRIAEIFWHTLAAWRAGKRPRLLEKGFFPEMQVGHHTAYKQVMAMAAGFRPETELKKSLEAETDDLEYSILAYGYAEYLRHPAGRRREAEKRLDSVLARDGFWISYAYLAAWNDRYG